jgi:CheY-like chemotaxis protein
MPTARHILIVDDHLQVRAVLARVVTQLWPDATIAETANGAEALSAATQRRPDLIITDYHMPIMDGLELGRTLRAQGATMPILLLSSDTIAVEALRSAGVTAFLQKPFSVRVLKQLLRTLLPNNKETQTVGG